MPVIAQTPRLIVKTFSADHEDAYVGLFADEQVRVHVPKRLPDENRKIFKDTLIEDASNPDFTKWAVVDAADGDFIGMCLLRPFENTSDTLEIGYAIHVKYWGQGICTELTRILIDYANTFPAIRAIVAVTTYANIPSQKVLEKGGLHRDGSIIRNNEELALYRINPR